MRINAAEGALGFVWFQLADGPNATDPEHRHGIRRLDDTWKHVAYKLASLGPTVA